MFQHRHHRWVSPCTENNRSNCCRGTWEELWQMTDLVEPAYLSTPQCLAGARRAKTACLTRRRHVERTKGPNAVTSFFQHSGGSRRAWVTTPRSRFSKLPARTSELDLRVHSCQRKTEMSMHGPRGTIWYAQLSFSPVQLIETQPAEARRIGLY